MKRRLFFKKDTFTILQAADVQDNAILSLAMRRLLKKAVAFADPDLIMLTGDNISGYACRTQALTRCAIRGLMKTLSKCGRPIAAVFGNHDDEDTVFTKDEQMALYETYTSFVGCAGVTAEMTVNGNTRKNVGTYDLPLYESETSDRILAELWCFDSGTYNPDESIGGYGLVFGEQIDWYREKSEALEQQEGKKVPGYAFQHIAPPQVFDALREVKRGTPGAVNAYEKAYLLPAGLTEPLQRLRESPCPPNPKDPLGHKQFDAFIERGDVKAVFFGHDHINSFVVPYKGVDLVSSPGCTFSSYNDDMRGFRIIRIPKSAPENWETETVTAVSLFQNDPVGRALLAVHRLMKKIEYGFDDLKRKLKK